MPLSGQQDVQRKVPKVGLVLSGGGAKGIAHLGVMKVLQEEGIPFDIIGGTSMGAIVGGLIASGIPVDTMINIIRSQDWDYLLSDIIRREDLSITEKRDRDRFLLSFPLSKKGLGLPEGIIRGEHIENMLHELTAPVYDIRNFNDLAIPYLCVALDIDHNKETVFHSGDLADVMRASMSIPSAFEPMVINGARMVDGGVVDNFPVRHVLAEGADIIIGVDVGHQKKRADYKPTLVNVMEDAIFYYSSIVKQESMKNVDLYIHPDLEGLGVSSFTAFDSLIAYGVRAARAKLPEIRRLADSLQRLGVRNRPVKYNRRDSVFIRSIQMEGLQNLSRRLIKSSLSFDAMRWVTPEELKQTAENFYSSNYFEKVTFSLIPEGDGARVIYHFREKKGGRFNAGLYYDTDYKTVLLFNTTFLNLLVKGTKLSLTAQVGRNPGFDFSYFIDRGPILSPGIEISGNFLEAYAYDAERRRADSYTYFISSLNLFAQSRINNRILLRAGGEMSHTSLQPKVSEINFGKIRDNFFGGFADVVMDTRDRPVFSTKGTKLLGKFKFLSNQYIHPIIYSNLDLQKPFLFTKKFSMINELFGGVTIGDTIPFQYYYWIGGHTDFTKYGNVPFPGYKFLEIGSKTLFFYRADLQYEIFKKTFVSIYGSMGTVATNVSEVFNTLNLISGGGFSVGYLTPIGPLRFSLSKSFEKRGVTGYFQVGFAF